jgi:hypothetical protein
MESLAAQIAALEGRLAELSRELGVIARLESPRPPLTLLGLVSRSARDCQGRLQVDHLSLRSANEGAKTAAKPSALPDGDSLVVTIKGIAMDNPTVARFAAALQQTKAFRRVELKSTKEQPLGASRVCAYLVECGY